jgi:DNA replication and repair protein RecF
VNIGIELDEFRSVVARKGYRLNGETVRAHDLIGVVKCVLFSPEDVVLVTGPPSERRRQVDILLSLTDRSYLHALAQYGRVLTQRNQLLRQFARDRRSVRDTGAVNEMSFWDEQLVAAGSVVMAFRHHAAERISAVVHSRSTILVDGANVGFAYVPRLELNGASLEGQPDRDRAMVAARFEHRLREVRVDEFRRGMSLVGPHRDDFRFLIEGRDLATYGSRGQQRLGVVAYKLAEIDVIDERSGERPVLLLDDVLSELDAVHRELLIAEIAACSCQVLVTSTDASHLEHPSLAHLPLIEIANGSAAIEPGAGENHDHAG